MRKYERLTKLGIRMFSSRRSAQTAVELNRQAGWTGKPHAWSTGAVAGTDGVVYYAVFRNELREGRMCHVYVASVNPLRTVELYQDQIPS